MKETLGSGDVYTRLLRIAELAREDRKKVFTSLHQVIDIKFLQEAYRRTRKDGATGVDGVTAKEYEQDLEKNLCGLLERFKSGTYRAPPVKRAYIPKGDGTKERPIGIPSLEDKILQRAVAMVMEAIYEQDFHSNSYAFRPKRSAHGALDALREQLMEMKGGWVLELDIKSFFDTLDHGHLRAFLDQRVRDGVLRKAIDKWLKAGVMEGGHVSYPGEGTPQGGVISPLLANIYLHHVLDVWVEDVVKPRMRGQMFLIRYADDAVLVFEAEHDAQTVLGVLPKRFGKYGLTLHPEKTRLLPFRRPPFRGSGPGEPKRMTFDFLGFTHYWSRSLKGFWVIKRSTAKGRMSRALRVISAWCKEHMHAAVSEQHRGLGLKLQGHFGYFGITGNYESLTAFRHWVRRIWRYWLNRRSQNARMTWEKFELLVKRYPLPAARVVHSI